MNESKENNIAFLINRVIEWNSKRYYPIYSHSLSESLLVEELAELHYANNTVEILDAVGDIAFVAIGIMWKMNIVTKDINHLFEIMPSDMSLIEYNQISDNYISYISDKYNLSLIKLLQLKLLCHAVFVTSYLALEKEDMAILFYPVLKIICTSNETKEVSKSKINPNVKANKLKGQNYVPPTQDLTNLITKYGERN